MLDSLKLENFTAFATADFEFAAGLNLFVGENGTGKTHILKAAYSALHVLTSGAHDSPTKVRLETAIAEKLYGVFRPDELDRLVRRDAGSPQQSEVSCQFSGTTPPLTFSFGPRDTSRVTVHSAPSAWTFKRAVYLPPRELLSIYPGFVSLYETTHLPFEETWRDTCLLLGAPLAKGMREPRIAKLLTPLEQAMGGRLELDKAGRFYLVTGNDATEIHLVAEGFRKLAMLARLIAAGHLVRQAFLFWDEPEANLNPKVIKQIAPIILHLCSSGVQVFIATHSLFVMRELDILLHQSPFRPLKARFFGLHRNGDGVLVRQGGSVDDIGTIDALQEELSQSERYLETEAR